MLAGLSTDVSSKAAAFKEGFCVACPIFRQDLATIMMPPDLLWQRLSHGAPATVTHAFPTPRMSLLSAVTVRVNDVW